MNIQKDIDVLHPREQKKLFNLSNKFNTFADLYKEKKMPQCIFLSGYKGIGKATLAYHLTNYKY